MIRYIQISITVITFISTVCYVTLTTGGIGFVVLLSVYVLTCQMLTALHRYN
jgi:hypothetical protein